MMEVVWSFFVVSNALVLTELYMLVSGYPVMGTFIVISNVLILTGLYLLISGYHGIGKNEKSSKKFFYSKKKIQAGVILFTIFGIVLIIGSSSCLSI